MGTTALLGASSRPESAQSRSRSQILRLDFTQKSAQDRRVRVHLRRLSLLGACQFNVFELWCCRRLLRVPWTTRSNQSILREINTEYSLEGLLLKLKVQNFGHLMQTTDSLEKTLMLGKIDDKRRGGQQRTDGWLASPIQGT